MDVSRILQVTHMALKQVSERDRMTHEDELSRVIVLALRNEKRLLSEYGTLSKKYDVLKTQLCEFQSEFAIVSRQINEMKAAKQHEYTTSSNGTNRRGRIASASNKESSSKKKAKNNDKEISPVPKPYLDFGCIDDGEEEEGEFVDESMCKSINKTQSPNNGNSKEEEEERRHDTDHITPLLTRERVGNGNISTANRGRGMLPPNTTSTLKDRYSASSRKRGWTSDRDTDAVVLETGTTYDNHNGNGNGNGNEHRKASRVSDFPHTSASKDTSTAASSTRMDENVPNVSTAITPALRTHKTITSNTTTLEKGASIPPKAPTYGFPQADKPAPGGSNFFGGKYNEVVRNKADRAQLPGHTCKDCLEFYQALVHQGIIQADEMEEKLRETSRHKCQHSPAGTPDGFWDDGFSMPTPQAVTIPPLQFSKDRG